VPLFLLIAQTGGPTRETLDGEWTDKPVKTLGIYVGHDKEECEN
jgi:hypothetical protein